MSQVHEQFNIDRHISMEHSIDPTGKKWEIKGERGSALVRAQPNPGSVVSIIPKEFAGQWTSAAVLKANITRWLNTQWDKSDEVKRLAALRGKPVEAAPVVEEVVEKKQTPEESLATLSPEIRAELGDIIERVVSDEEALATYESCLDPVEEKPAASKKKVTKKG